SLILTFFPKFKSLFFEKLESLFRIEDLKVNELIESKRKKLLDPLKNLKSRDAKLKQQNAVRILEFGIGCGSNLAHYPPNTRLVAVDTNPLFEEQLLTILKKHENVTLEKFLVTCASNLSEIDDESVDAIVCTHTFCCVDDQLAVAKELKRILVQGGKFYFFEHVGYRWRCGFRGQKEKLYRILQCLVRPLWRVWFNNCRLGYRPRPILLKAGFADVSTEYFECKEQHFIIRPNVIGIATRLL
ncbi:methyltransferase-like protein 7A, partial [Leptotrombidium deliense]